MSSSKELEYKQNLSISSFWIVRKAACFLIIGFVSVKLFLLTSPQLKSSQLSSLLEEAETKLGKLQNDLLEFGLISIFKRTACSLITLILE